MLVFPDVILSYLNFTCLVHIQGLLVEGCVDDAHRVIELNKIKNDGLVLKLFSESNTFLNKFPFFFRRVVFFPLKSELPILSPNLSKLFFPPKSKTLLLPPDLGPGSVPDCSARTDHPGDCHHGVDPSPLLHPQWGEGGEEDRLVCPVSKTVFLLQTQGEVLPQAQRQALQEEALQVTARVSSVHNFCIFVPDTDT